ncbi:1-Cys peroxiredoxin [Aneurinibacillus soli]|uniref:Peroxiredoxin n=1 Tax=Aneurinibacillus soli TaxID=1500254 RepID=A0A0U5BE24_9BACL|nr:peroxiredoxin [Aneurinibacillus soli]PYE61199.1 1-Cys peroxiredoxin [Aneurinibacillus soli]BAU26366.1 Selenocysteine-containing peroxiredoxin PrxU [Aneurinibacillus soli]
MSDFRIPVIGDPFPSLTVKTTLGTIKLPDAYQGKWFILFSHPGDFTPVCTTEFVSFETMRPQFAALNCELIGLSVDQVFSHLKWIEWIRKHLNVNITFPVIADALGHTARRLGMMHPEHGTATVRSVFIIDDRGVIRLILQYPAEVGRNISEILRAVQALQTATSQKAATPANWPCNELIGSHLIVPPADSVQEIAKRNEQCAKQEISCYDWWFCFKNHTS